MLLCASARPPKRLKSLLDADTISLLVFKCAHDSLINPSTGKKVVPHFIADCTTLCKQLADATAKERFQDNERQLYEVTVANAQKKVKAKKKNVAKHTKNVRKAKQKANKATAKLKKPLGTKVAAKAQKAADKAQKTLAKNQKDLQKSETELAEAEKRLKDELDNPI